MFHRPHTSNPFFAPKSRLAAAALMGALLLGSPLAAYAQSDTGGDSKMAARASTAEEHEDTINQRITTLHEELKITPAEETDWQAVAQTMRDNAAAMEKMASDKASQSQQGMTAVQDLQTYADFAQAHVAHLQKLTAAFSTLYNAMPDDQKKLADQVFAQSRQHHRGGQG